jgi:hypothetical protein
MSVFHVNGGSEAANVFGNVIAKHYGAHTGFAGAAFAHEQHLALLLPS